MPQARRTVYVFFHCHDTAVPDLEAFFEGEARTEAVRQVFAISLLKGEEYPVERDEVDFALSLPSDRWVDVAPADERTMYSLAEKGVVVTDAPDGELETLRRRDEVLGASGWNLYGALHYLMTKWRDVDLRESPHVGDFPIITEETIAQFIDMRGRPPDPFYAVEESLATVDLPLVKRDGALYDLLAARKTTRGYDRAQRMTLDELSVALYTVWGCHGTTPILGDVFCMKRTSPSGGCLHPVEVYPLVSGVAGIDSGLYHYNVRDHALELLEALPEHEAVELAASFVCGQAYFGSAHVTFVMTARFPRNHWKYPKQQKAYPVILMDAAHLSQTLYLVAGDLGLGAFVTAAINGLLIEERLGLDGITEGAVAVAGCGRRRQERSPLEPAFTPYVPRETVV
ncbi:MAG TPA: putative peptide maturation dehydrogenase [Gaiellaceae bacterium]|nr:putative peptide maturation dehydrogenase [Gaiellaceae bacterium]